MNARNRMSPARRWLRLALAIGLAIASAALHSGSADAAPVGPTTVLAGLTSQGFPSFFVISNNGRTLKLGAMAVGMTCASGDEFVFTDRDVRIPITRSGKIRADFAQAPSPVSGGGTEGGTDTLNAKLNPTHTTLSGTWRVQETYISSSGQTDQCDSGPVQLTDVG